VSKVGDLIQLGNHRIYCGDSRLPTSFAIVMGGQLAVLIISDAPYNVPISGHVGGSGKIKHHEFVQGAGELTDAAFVSLLSDVVANLVTFSVPGSLHLHFMDWRHFRQILDAAEPQYERLMNVIVWDKNVGGMGTFYRSRHEEIFIFKKGGAAHINNFGLGAKGRYRTNVWNYRGLNSGGAGRLEELAIHPTAKPVRMLADAMIDLSAPNSIVLDPYGGSGSTLIAAEKTGRRARIIELDPIYVDRMVRRFQKYTKQDALFADTGETFSARERRLKASRALAARIVRPGSTPSSRIVDFTFEEVA
jgi:DNA modification methylase